MKKLTRAVAGILALALLVAAVYGIWSGELDNERPAEIRIVAFLFIGLVFALYAITGESGMSRGLWKLFGKPGKHNDN